MLQDVAWLPCWLQNLRADDSHEFLKDSQGPHNQEVKDPARSPPENGSDGKYINVLSKEDCGYRSCHLLLSAEDSSLVSSAPPEHVFHFSLRLSSDAESFPTQDLNEFHDAVSPHKICSLQPVQASIDFGQHMRSVTDHLVYEHNLLPASIPETVKRDISKSPTDTNDVIRQHKVKSNIKCFTSDSISDAVELSIAASEVLAIHDLVNMESFSELMHTENVLEVALRMKLARLVGLDNGFHSSSEDSNSGDSLSDLNDFVMEEAYEDIGLLSGVSVEEHLCNSIGSQPNGVSIAKNYSEKEITSHVANVDVEMEMHKKTDSPLDSLCCEREMHSDGPGLGSTTLRHVENSLPTSQPSVQNNSNALAQNQVNETVGAATVEFTPCVPENDVPLAVETTRNFKNENLATYLAPERFRSRWLGGWTNKESEPSSSNRNNSDRIPEVNVRETSFLSESVDIFPDASSCVQKHDPKCAIGSQLSMHSDSLHKKPDEDILHSEDVVRCSNLSLIDPLCSVVPCSISEELSISSIDKDKEHNTENFVTSISEFVVDTFQRISNNNATLGCRDEKMTPSLGFKDIPITETEVVKQMPKMLTCVEHIDRKQLNPPLPTGATSLGTRKSESEDGNENEENNRYFVDHKANDGLMIKPSDARGILEEQTQDSRSLLILNNRTRRFLAPKTVLNDVRTDLQIEQNNNYNELQVVCNNDDGKNVGVRKKVHFSEKVEELDQKRKLSKLEPSYRRGSSVKTKRKRVSKSSTASELRMKHPLTNYCRTVGNEFIFQGTQFLLTGLSRQKERDIEALIWNSGGVVLSDIPSPPNSRGKRSLALSSLQLPVILCTRKMQTTKFLYGCAVGASVLKVDWLTDCLKSRAILQPEKYLILPKSDMSRTKIGTAIHYRDRKHIFERVGIMLHGKHSFCNKLASIIRHGDGQVFKTLQQLVRSIDEKRTLVAAIVAEDSTMISHHLKHCAMEGGIPIMPFGWIVKSLHSGKLLPFTEKNNSSPLPFDRVSNPLNMSEEI
ncbi:hypothetical protein PIB30_068506 [Stylosanthes scabra]|uniref:BRCT domain-containing protein n=1 Tax=Stylosanthes scabra TaxID=79078 RepID=A0ABU6XKQ5_9FABA|nr:hypothetical protein [Stylosanthes scabra]